MAAQPSTAVLGCSGPPLILTPMLFGTKQVVRHTGKESNECKFECGIPQGSCLGPTLYIYYINPIDPRDLPSKLRYFPRISPNSLKISPKFRATNHIQSLTNAHIFIKTRSFPLCLRENFTGFNLIYCTPVCG